MEVKIEGKELIIRIALENPTPSASGKTAKTYLAHQVPSVSSTNTKPSPFSRTAQMVAPYRADRRWSHILMRSLIFTRMASGSPYSNLVVSGR